MSENKIFNKKDYSKFIAKLKEKRFIEQFADGFGYFNIHKFYSKLEKYLHKDDISFNNNYDTSIEQIKIIDSRIKEILNKYFDEESPRILIRAYIVGRASYYKDKYTSILSLNEIPLSTETKKIASENNLTLEIAKRVEVALNYSNTTLKFISSEQLIKVRKIIIDEFLIKNQPMYKLINMIFEVLPRDDSYLLNVDWQLTIDNELNYICDKARILSKSMNNYVICVGSEFCCDDCSRDMLGKIFRLSEAPQLPYEKCSVEICKCNLISFHPEYQYLSNGRIKLKVENEKEWRLWYLKNIELKNVI